MFYQSGFKDLQLASMKRALSQSQGSNKTRRTRKATRKRRKKKESIFLGIYCTFLFTFQTFQTLNNPSFRRHRPTRYGKQEKKQKDEEENVKLNFLN